MDSEFTALEKQIREKVAAAGQLLNEANELAKQAHDDLREFTYDDRLDWGLMQPLFDHIDIAGWSTSSLSC